MFIYIDTYSIICIVTCTLVYQTGVSLKGCSKYVSTWISTVMVVMGSPALGEYRYACVSDNVPTLEPYFNELLGS